MSNTKHTRWSEAEVDASNFEQLLGAWLAEGQAYAARTVIMRDLAAEFTAAGAEPGVIAAMEQGAMAAGTEFWAGMYRDMMARAPGQ